MSRNILFLLLIFFVTINSKKQFQSFESESEEILKMEETEEGKNQSEEMMNLHKMNELLNLYIEVRHWESDLKLDKDTFCRMFIYVVQKSIFKKHKREDLEILGERIVEKYGKPLLIKNIRELFVVDELKIELAKIVDKDL